MILVTGAAGKTGRAILRALISKQREVRGLVRRPEQVKSLQQIGAQDVIVGDMLDPTCMESASSGIQAVYHICPNVHPREVEIGEIAIGAALAAGVETFVFHSVLHPQTEEMPHHWKKLRVEEMLFASDLEHIILQPSAYMQNILAHWDSVVEKGIYPVPYSAEARLSIVDLQDVVEVAASVLTQPGHAGATYELSGLDPLSQHEVAATLGVGLGRPVEVVTIPLEEWEQQARRAGLGEYRRETLIRMFQYYDRHGLRGNPQVLTWLLGRPPTTFSEFVERTVQERQSK
jgi:uncharacterized protein YbjT (DUF2867 family)